MNLKNTYYLVRHGQAVSNVIGVYSSWPEMFENPLTDQGRTQAAVAAAALALKATPADLIIASDVLRARQTAQIIAKALQKEIITDARLREIDFGIFNGKARETYGSYFKNESERINGLVPQGESYNQVRTRIAGFLQDTESGHQGKNIIVVSHKCPLWIMQSVVMGITLAEALKTFPSVDERFANGEIKVLSHAV